LYLPPKAVDKRIGKELGVGYVVEGSVRKDGDKLRIVSQFIETKNGEHVWAERFDRAGSMGNLAATAYVRPGRLTDARAEVRKMMKIYPPITPQA